MRGKLEMIYFWGTVAQEPPGYAHGGGARTGSIQWCYIYSTAFNMKTH